MANGRPDDENGTHRDDGPDGEPDSLLVTPASLAALPDHHFSGITTVFLASYLDAQPEAVQRKVLELAGEQRPLADLMVSDNWSSYDQVRRLLEATSTVLGGPEVLYEAGSSWTVEGIEDLVSIIQSMGSPDVLLRMLSQMNDVASPLLTMTTTDGGPNHSIVEITNPPGFPPFAEYCHYVRGMLAQSTLSFGIVLADVTETTCQRLGGATCRFDVRWEPADGPEARIRFLEAHADVLQARLDTLQDTVGDLVSGEGVDQVLGRLVATTARSVSAPTCVLVLRETHGDHGRVYRAGLSEADAEQVAVDLLERAVPAIPHAVVVDIASPQHHYGKLAAVYTPGHQFFEQERRIIQTHARLAAAFLDSERAIQDARRQEATARTLLALSTSLAAVATLDEVAGKLVRAVRELIECQRSALILLDRSSGVAHFAASEGYPNQVWDDLLTTRFPIDDRLVAAGAAEDAISDLALPDHVVRRMGGPGTAFEPIVARGELLGWLTASVPSGSRPLTDPDAKARLQGLAGQAATAVRNARLLDQIRHQALHDPLTGLPNRALILDRVEQMLTRTRRTRSLATLLFIDLDGFKEVNDTFRHAAGDQLLRSVAARLAGSLRLNDTLGRLGGDEFIVLAESDTDDRDPALVAQRLLAVLEEPFEIGLATVTVTASIGIAAGDRQNAGDLLHDADIALYQAKQAGKNRAVLFDPGMRASILEQHRDS